MRKFFTLLFCALLTTVAASAQSKVFKEVSSDISSDMEAIVQDGALVGYLVFTQLEKASEDSFNYKITIMDENLNDIGVVNFRDEKLDLQAVSFEQDVLCLAYLKSNIIGRQFSNGRAYKKAMENSKTAIVTQFLNLDGKIIKENYTEVVTDKDPARNYSTPGKFTIDTRLKQKIQLANIPQKGFACFYGDENKKALTVYSATGNQLWTKNVDDALAYSLLTTKDNIFILYKKKEKMLEGGYSINVFSTDTNERLLSYELKDKNDNWLKVLGFGNDAATGKPFISGNIINKNLGNNFLTGKQLTKGLYDGVFTLSFNGPKRTDVKEVYSYWSDGSQTPAISKTGRYAENDAYAKFSNVTRDYQGNTYFIGPAFVKKPKWGTIASAVVFSPLILVSPMILVMSGTVKCKITSAMILKQNNTGTLSFENTIDCNTTAFHPGRQIFEEYYNSTYYNVTNADTKTNYVIIDDNKNIVLYNISQKKIARTVPHKDGQIRTNIFPAKEGHIMVAEYNKKEKYTRLSIEAL